MSNTERISVDVHPYFVTSTDILKLDTVRGRAREVGAPRVVVIPAAAGTDAIIDVLAVADTLPSDVQDVLARLCDTLTDTYRDVHNPNERPALAERLRDIADDIEIM